MENFLTTQRIRIKELQIIQVPKRILVVQLVLINQCLHQVRVVQPKVVVILVQAQEVALHHQVAPVVQAPQPVQEVKYVACRKSKTFK